MEIKTIDEIKDFVEIEKTIDERNIRLYFVKNILLTGYSSHYPDILFKEAAKNYLLLPIKEMCMSLNKKSYYEENGLKFDYKESIPLNINYIIFDVYFFIYNTENYYHFIYDTLPYLYCFLKLKEKNKNIKLLMNYNKNKNYFLPFVKESLELLNIKDNDILIHDNNNIYSNLYFSNSLTHDNLSNNPPRKEIFEIYKIMIENAKKNITNFFSFKHDNIYISRRTWINEKQTDNIGTNYTTKRKLMNEDELVDNLKKKDFIEIFGENYSMTEKILLFNNAQTIIGAIGGTICNCVFCNDKCKIVSIVSPDFLNINFRMKYLFNNNVILFNDTYLDCKDGEIPLYVRIEITDEKSSFYKNLGEIEKIENNKYIINLSKNFIGWNTYEQYDKILLYKEQFKTLDNGINSPWKIDINKLLKEL
jgi:hypothetical protein